jgi:LPS O-antigen subunit length determinant protein (WzzB/FepE family)
MISRMTSDGVARAQAELSAITFELLALQERLERIHRRLPVPADQEAMLEGEIAPDVATEVSGCLECVTEDELKRVIESLQHAATVTPRELEHDFRRQQERRRRREDCR